MTMDQGARIDCFECKVCNLKVKDALELIKHYWEYHPKPMFPGYCFLCERFFKNKQALRMHVRMKHQEAKWETETKSHEISSPAHAQELIITGNAGCKTATAYRSGHEEMISSVVQSCSPCALFVCSVCDRQFKNCVALRLHERQVHTRPFGSQCHPIAGVNSTDSNHELSLVTVLDNSICSETAAEQIAGNKQVWKNESSQSVASGSSEKYQQATSNQQPVNLVQGDIMACSMLRLLDETPSREISNMDFCDSIAAANDMIAVQVPGDGDCQYHAVIESLKAVHYVESLDVEDLRKRVYEEIMTDQTRYQDFLSQDQGSFDVYAYGVLGNAWGDELTLQALASSLNIRIYVYEFTCNSQFIHALGNANSEYSIFLTLDNRRPGTAHYSALIRSYLALENVIVASQNSASTSLVVQRERVTEWHCIVCDKFFKRKIGLDGHNRKVHKSSLMDVELLNKSCTGCDNADNRSITSEVSYDGMSDGSVESSLSDGRTVRKSARLLRKMSVQLEKSLFVNPDHQVNLGRQQKIGQKLIGRQPGSIVTSCVDETSNQMCVHPKTSKKSRNQSVCTANGNERTFNRTSDILDLHSSSATDQANNSVRRSCRSTGGKTREHNLIISLERELSNLKRNNRPWTKSEMETDDTNYHELKRYHDYLSNTLDNFSTEKISAEVADVIDVDVMKTRVNTDSQQYTWPESDERKLNYLKDVAKTLKPPLWPWNAPDGSTQGKYNHSRMQFLVTQELQHKILKCPQCGVTTVLVGHIKEIQAEKCIDCLELNRKKTETRKKYEEAWQKVKPAEELPKKIREESGTVQELPRLNPAEQSVVALVQPAVTIKRNYLANKQFKQESLNFVHNAEKTWCKILPRKSLQDRFVIIERRFNNGAQKYMIANPEKVREWLRYLFAHHSTYMRKKDNGELELSQDALDELSRHNELALVEYDASCSETDAVEKDETEYPPPSIELDAGLSKKELYSFDHYDYLYLRKEHMLRINEKGKIEIIKDNGSVRQPLYNPQVSANISFPHLYPNGESAPLDCGQHTLARYLLKKQSQFAQKRLDGGRQWTHSEDGVHMMSQYARLVEMNIRSVVGWYVNQHPERANIPVQSLIDAFKEGMSHDEGAIDSQLPELQGIMSQMRNSRESWFAQRLGLESLSMQMGEANLFFTLNMDIRAWQDTRKLLYELNEGSGSQMPDDYFETDTQKFTTLVDKYATQLSVYLSKKSEKFMKAFLVDICRVPEKERGQDCAYQMDRSETGWYWARCEFNSTRGCQHYHGIAKLPGTLDTAILSRMIQNMRIVREELKYRNIRNYDSAWDIIKYGLFATQYIVLLADSMSTCSFFDGEVDKDHFDENRVIDLNPLRNEYVQNYIKKDINKRTHPIMRQFFDEECEKNENLEQAKVASVSCMHFCLQNACGGDEKTSKGCRFSYPHKKMKYTVPAVLDLQENQMELQILLRRTNERIPHLQKYFLQYWRANHDFTVLADSAHKMRYVSKYVSKSGQIETLLNEVIDYLQQKSSSIQPPSFKQSLTQLLLSECSHRIYMSKQQLAFKVQDLAEIYKSFPDVKVVAHYPRATVVESSPFTESGVVEISDRTDYSAYSERCLENTETKGDLTKEQLSLMNLREFSERVGFRWILNKTRDVFSKCHGSSNSNLTKVSEVVATGNNSADENELGSDNELSVLEEMQCTTDSTTASRVKWRCRDKRSGHWLMWRKLKPVHIRPSTLLYTDLARRYVPDESVSRFFDLPTDKRDQLKRAYMELIFYLPWQDDPDTSFLSDAVIKELTNENNDPDAGSRYSLKRLHEYFKVYMQKWEQGLVAPAGSQWHRDNQFSFTMYLANRHNRTINDDRLNNDGIFVARYESADELHGTEVEIQPRLSLDTDNDEYPSALNFLPCDILQEVEQQGPPAITELRVAFADHELWRNMRDNISKKSDNLFMANPSRPEVEFECLTPMQKHAYHLIADGVEQIVYVSGKAGAGKSLIAVHLAERFVGRVQIAAGTGRAASNFNGPTIYGAFMWSANINTSLSSMSPAKKQTLQNFYKNTDLFIFDEIDACGANILDMIDQTMKELFCSTSRVTGKRIEKAFGGKKVLFLGDPAQLRPIGAAAVYDKGVNWAGTKYRSAGAKLCLKSAQRGQQIYREYLVPKCVWLQKGQRNSGLLQQLMDNLRDGKQTEQDLDKLLFQRQKYPDRVTDRGIHYSNESAALYNCRQLWDDCKLLNRHFYSCRALYHMNDDNEYVVRTLSGIPASQFNYAPDVLCLTEGCEVRLITNVNTYAGLVTNSVGRVIEIIYENGDVPALLQGEHPPAYCIIVHFPGFRGFPSKSSMGERFYPFSDHNLVPVYRRRFRLDKIPENIRKLQAMKLCYREQFPIDLSTNLTAHRGQGQTWKDCTLSVNLGFESPQNKIPPDAASITYVACTRITRLKDLFVSPIFPSVWLELGKSEQDVERRQHEKVLKAAAKNFASLTGMYDECVAEMEFQEDYSTVDDEWQKLVNEDSTSLSCLSTSVMSDEQLALMKQVMEREAVPVSVKPALKERYIGIDQGMKTFSMVAIDRSLNGLPKVVGAAHINLLEFGLLENRDRCNAADVLLLLEEHSPLFDWMQRPAVDQTDEHHTRLDEVDRVIVAVEQISVQNAYCKPLGQELASLIQRQFDVSRCIVKMSQPHVHRKNGPMFKLGDEIREACKLEPASYESVRTRIERKRHSEIGIDLGSHNGSKRRRRAVVQDDVEPSDTSSGDELGNQVEKSEDVYESLQRTMRNEDYKKKKAMSAAIFKYFINATVAQQMGMQVEIESRVQEYWLNQGDMKKFDDLGDALLHALDQILCNASKYRQLVPSSLSLQKNRTVVVVILPEKAYWITMKCFWNQFVIEDMGTCSMPMKKETFGSERAVNLIAKSLHPRLLKAVTEFNPSDEWIDRTDYIRIIVKQLKGYEQHDVSPKAAGSLTNSAVKAITNLCDVVLPNSTLSINNNKKTGWEYSRVCKSTGRKIQVTRSSGKHLNSVLSCLQWMRLNLPDVVRDRPMKIDGKGRLLFFEALRSIAFREKLVNEQSEKSAKLEFIELGLKVVGDLQTCNGYSSNPDKKTIGDLILIALNNNQQYISAISTNFRRSKIATRGSGSVRRNLKRKRDANHSDDQSPNAQSVNEVCVCFSSSECKARKHMRLNIFQLEKG